MGMYTGLRFKGVIKEEFAEMVKTMIEERLDWMELCELYPQYEFLKEFGERHRSSFIPFGALEVLHDEWGNDDFVEGYNTETRIWSFQCSLKNYDQDIEKFFEVVLTNILEKSIHIEYYYEEWDSSTFYEFADGVIQLKKKEVVYEDLYGMQNYW